ncbi:Uncharacterised protein [Candidatus Anstonella stagnisolia]|nr:Uncharacterised protein [Candidatus Anstonella stagnisolia]
MDIPIHVGKGKHSKKGFAFTIDVLLALFITFFAFIISFNFLTSFTPASLQFVHLRTLSLDALSVMEKQSYLSDAAQGPDVPVPSTSLRDFLLQTPPQVCMQVQLLNSTLNEVYSVEKSGCTLGGEDFQVAWRSFIVRHNATSYDFYLARLTSWYSQPT